MDIEGIRKFVDGFWDDRIMPALSEYISIPSVSPDFDPDWQANGEMDRAAELIARWVGEQNIEGLKLDRLQDDGRTPLLFADMPGTGDDESDTVLLYGHFDKQPPLDGWDEGLGPWTPVVRDGRLYGRGGADDGYAAFASLAAIEALRRQGLPRRRCVILLEGSEESGSIDLPHYIDVLSDRIGKPSLIVCLDSGCGNYDQMWCTTSLRGVISGVLSIDILREGVHSGEGTGVFASTFRVLRQLLSRVEDQDTGEILVPSLHCDIPAARRDQATATTKTLGEGIWRDLPFVEGARPVSEDLTELYLNRTWRPTLAVTGADGLPPAATAGNVLRPTTKVKLSFRLAPGADPEVAMRDVKSRFETDPPYGARVRFELDPPAAGWNAPPLAPWLEKSASEASQAFFGKEACYMGEGGAIPFMSMLGDKFPEAQFLITGVLGPNSNAHGPNEFLDIATTKRLIACTAKIIANHATR